MIGARPALQGLRVVELGTLVAGPFAGRLLAEFGAEVVKVEPPGGDPLRNWRIVRDGTSLWWYAQGRNKKSIVVDLRRERGREVVRRLAGRADVLIENYRPGQLEKWDLGWERLSAQNPRLVLVRISGYGQTGPYRNRPGFGSIGEAMGGIRHVTGEPGRPPVRAGISLSDSLAGLYAVIGALVALQARERTGRGQVVDVALYEAVFGLMESLVTEYGAAGFVREPSGGALPGIAASNTYLCSDGYVVIGGNADAIFRRLMALVGRPDLAADPALADNAGRVARVAEIDAAIQAWTSRRTLDDALRGLEGAEVPAGRIYDARDIVNDVHYRARQMIEERDGFLLPGIVPRLSGTPGGTRWIGPRLGEHTAEVLASVGYGDADQAALRGEGAVA
jgi:formyl-CoA transferase